jgi:hypothetical protein
MSRVEILPYTDVTISMETRTSKVALVGLILSALGWLTCGLTSVLGVPLSLISLFCRGSKGAGIAGVVLGLPPICVLVTLLFISWGVKRAAEVATSAAQNFSVVMGQVGKTKLENEPAAVEALGVIESIEWDLLRSGEESQKQKRSVSAFRVKGSRNSGVVLMEVKSDDPKNTNPDIQWAILIKDDGTEVPLVDNGKSVEVDSLK